MRGFAAVAAVVLALCSAASFGIADFFGGLATKRLRVLIVMVVSQATGLAGIAILVAIRGDGPPEAVLRARSRSSRPRSAWSASWRSTAGSPSG